MKPQKRAHPRDDVHVDDVHVDQLCIHTAHPFRDEREDLFSSDRDEESKEDTGHGP